MGTRDHDARISAAFTEQAAAFAISPTMHDASVLDAIAELAAPTAGEAWLDAACGPGIVARRIAAAGAGSVHGIDLTPEMTATAERETFRAGVAEVRFSVGDVTATGLPDGAFAGAVTRFSLHHVPLPGRVLRELARVVAPGGRIVVADHLADDDLTDYAFTQEIERLRDPSHWASLTADGLHRLAAGAGLAVAEQRIVPLALDLDEWLHRGTRDRAARELVEDRLRERPGGTPRFGVSGRTLSLRIWVGALQRV